jgi:hypothetical protein
MLDMTLKLTPIMEQFRNWVVQNDSKQSNIEKHKFPSSSAYFEIVRYVVQNSDPFHSIKDSFVTRWQLHLFFQSKCQQSWSRFDVGLLWRRRRSDPMDFNGFALRIKTFGGHLVERRLSSTGSDVLPIRKESQSTWQDRTFSASRSDRSRRTSVSSILGFTLKIFLSSFIF